jgi:hypothetical protein
MADSKVVANSGKKKPPRAGLGRPKGAVNKVTKTLREAIESSFEKVGGADYLAKMATEQPASYMTLLGKVLPAHMNHKVEQGKFELIVKRANADKPDPD